MMSTAAMDDPDSQELVGIMLICSVSYFKKAIFMNS